MATSRPLPNGSEPSWQTSLLTVQEIANMLGLPVDTARSKLLNQGIAANIHDRFPFDVIADALLAEGWVPERLQRLR